MSGEEIFVKQMPIMPEKVFGGIVDEPDFPASFWNLNQATAYREQ
ncbi:hypothetical protein FOVG_03589 [Fusarium oxysporum f. sp. pisi HDV247]|uniref:Uncharacterized protein n=1 Tax=Fusarium oxysporum f. sp. pisi HDV247 TaxID=1080344 RepID=W9Q964_FUSOX|nr:hypothetical protein FOVG_03589 [Fusarium oxysporum f. sp. pisi HDV247]